MATQATEHDFLDDDLVTVPGQAFALVSFVSPRSNQKSDVCAMKIRGVFGTKEEAGAHAKKLMRLDASYDIFMVDMYKWLAVPPDPNKIEEQEYSEKFLNDMLKDYKKSQLEAKQHFKDRQRLAMEQGLEAVLTPEERVPPLKDDGPSQGAVSSELFEAREDPRGKAPLYPDNTGK